MNMSSLCTLWNSKPHRRLQSVAGLKEANLSAQTPQTVDREATRQGAAAYLPLQSCPRQPTPLNYLQARNRPPLSHGVTADQARPPPERTSSRVPTIYTGEQRAVSVGATLPASMSASSTAIASASLAPGTTSLPSSASRGTSLVINDPISPSTVLPALEAFCGTAWVPLKYPVAPIFVRRDFDTRHALQDACGGHLRGHEGGNYC